MNQIGNRTQSSVALFALACGVVLVLPTRASAREASDVREPARRASVAEERAGGVLFAGSTIASIPANLPELIYRKYPTDRPVGPSTVWQLSFGAVLASMAPSINVTLQLDPGSQNPDVQVLDGSAVLVPQDGFYNNYDSAERFEIAYNGTLDPFVGPVDFLLEPDGFNAIPVRVHLNVTDQPGFSIPFFPIFAAAAPIGDVNGDGTREIIASGEFGGVEGVFAFDHAGNLLPGWPFRDDDPEILEQGYGTPNVVDLDGDGSDEVVVLGSTLRDAQGRGEAAGSVTTETLQVIEGSRALLWQIVDAWEGGVPAVGDLDGDSDLDIVIGANANLRRFEIDGTPVQAWQVQSPNNVHVHVPVIANVDGNPLNGMEIVACTHVLGQPNRVQVYIWKEDGSLLGPMWPLEMDGRCVPLTVVDLDRNPANGLEIVLPVDQVTDPPVDPKTGHRNTLTIFAWHADGNDVNGWPHHFFRAPNIGLVDDRVIAGASAADLDGDGDVEVVVGTYGQGNQAHGNLFLFHHDGTLDADWPRWAGVAQTPSIGGGAALGDLDGDGVWEIVAASIRGVYAFRADGRSVEGFPKLTSDNFGQPMIADLDADGRLEIAQASLWDRLYVWRFATPSPDPSSWPRFRQNPRNTATRHRAPIVMIPTVSEVGLVVMCCLLVGAGVFMIRREAETPVGCARQTE